MTRGLLLLGIALTLAGAPASTHAGPARVEGRLAASPERARDVLRAHPLRGLDGRTLSLRALEGEVVVVNFWASWCAPCRRELPRLDALHASIAPKGGRVLAVSIDHEARSADRFTKKHKLRLPVFHDGPEGLARALDLPHVPFTIVLDRSGAVAYTTSGSDDAALAELERVTRRLMTAATPVVSRDEQGGTR